MIDVTDNTEDSLDMPRKGPGVTAAGDNIVATWFDYRYQAKGQARHEVIRELNDRLGRSYSNSRVYEWVQGNMSAPDSVLEVIDEELQPMLRWFFKENNWPTKGVNMAKLSRAIRPAIKRS